MRIAHKAMPFDNFYLGCKHLFVSIRDKHVKVTYNFLGILCGMASPELKTKPICMPLPVVMSQAQQLKPLLSLPREIASTLTVELSSAGILSEESPTKEGKLAEPANPAHFTGIIRRPQMWIRFRLARGPVPLFQLTKFFSF